MTTTTKTPPTGRQIAVRALRLNRRPDGQLADLWTKTGLPVRPVCDSTPSKTATWKPEAMRGGKMRHVVTLDPDFGTFVNVSGTRVRSVASLVRLGTAMLRHEKWHGIITERDLPKLADYCDRKGVAFTAMNIGEDVRLEDRARKAEGTTFDWTVWRSVDIAKTDEPLAWLFAAKHCETLTPPTRWSGVAKVERIVGGKPDGKGLRIATEVLREVFRDLCTAATTFVVVDVLADLFATFPAAKRDPKDVDGIPPFVTSGFGGEGKASGAMPTTETQYHEDYRTVDPSGLSPVERAAIDHFTSNNHQPKHWTMPHAAWAVEGPKAGIRIPDLSTADATARRLAQMLGQVDSPRMNTATSGSRLHLPNVIVGDSASFRTPAKQGGKRKVVAIFDQSGSMHGDWMTHGAAFAAALMLLHKRGIIDATVVLTGGRKYAVIPPHADVNVLTHCYSSHGCESVDATLAAVKDKVVAADTVLIYTDGNLTDGAVDAGHWRALGVDLIGCALNHSDPYMTARKKTEMVKHFSRAILADSAPRMATAIVQYLATKK